MHRDNKKDILLGSKAVRLLSNADLAVIGGGRASEIKVETFSKLGFGITVVAPSISEKIVQLSEKFEGIKLKRRSFRESDIEQAYLIMIGTDSESLNREIADKCREKKKLHIYLSDFKRGDMVVPYERETRELNYTISTKRGSPKTARYLAKKVESLLLEYDDFVEYICHIRASIRDRRLKSSVMEFVNTDEFYEFYKAGLGDVILGLFFGGDIFEKENSN